MGGVAIDKDDVEIITRQVAAKLCNKLQAPGAAADDNDLGFFAVWSCARHRAPVDNVPPTSDSAGFSQTPKSLAA